MFIFYWPWFALLLPLPILVKLFFSKKQAEDVTPEIRFPNAELIKKLYSSPRPSSANYRFKQWGLWALWLCLVLAIMRPQWVDDYTKINSHGYDVLMAVDLSASMKALDFSTRTSIKNRLDVTKEVVSDFVKDRQGDRVGLILFGQQAFLHVPLTLDTLSVSAMLNNSIAGMAGDSTAIGDAIGLAVSNLRERPEGSRIIILLTDGEDTASTIPPIKAAELAKDYGIKIYTIGIGRQNRVPYPDGKGGVITVNMNMDEALLQSIADLTGAQYFKATDVNALRSIYQSIDRLEKSESDVREYRVREPLFRYPLAMAALLLLLVTLLRLNRRPAYGF